MLTIPKVIKMLNGIFRLGFLTSSPLKIRHLENIDEILPKSLPYIPCYRTVFDIEYFYGHKTFKVYNTFICKILFDLSESSKKT